MKRKKNKIHITCDFTQYNVQQQKYIARLVQYVED